MSYQKWHEKQGEEFESVTKNGKTYCIGEMLHGYCDLFAIQLGKFLKEKNIPFKYGILSDDEEGLIHSYLYVCDEKICNNTELIIDVRGITDDFEEFFDEFSDFFSYSSWVNGWDNESAINHYKTEKQFKKVLSELCFENLDYYFNLTEIIEKADEIIQAFQEYYIP